MFRLETKISVEVIVVVVFVVVLVVDDDKVVFKAKIVVKKSLLDLSKAFCLSNTLNELPLTLYNSIIYSIKRLFSTKKSSDMSSKPQPMQLVFKMVSDF